MRTAIDREEEQRRWLLFQLFLVREHGFTVDDAAAHVAWIQQQKFEGQPLDSVDSWMGAPGTTWRQRDARGHTAYPATFPHAWVAFQAQHGARSAESLEHTLHTLNTTPVTSQESR